MKILEYDEKTGLLKLQAESSDDLWILHLAITPGDIVYARTTREIKQPEGGGSRRIPLTLGIRVKATEFQPFTRRLRIRGIIMEGPDKYGLKGLHHTISIEPGSILVIVKEEGWPKPLLKKIRGSGVKGILTLIVALDYDEYSIALASNQGVRIVSSGRMRLPGKDDAGRSIMLEQRLAEIDRMVVGELERHRVSAIIVAGPGSLKDELAARLRGKGVRVMVDSVSMGGEAGVHEVIRRGRVREILEHISIVEAERLLEEFMRLLAKDPERVAYGLDQVYEAAAAGAVEHLLVLDEYVGSMDLELRRRVEETMTLVDKARGKVHIVPRNSGAGLRLRHLGGLAAILRYRFSQH